MFEEKNGLVFKGLCIDPYKKPSEKNVLLSHAHADHVKLSKESTFFCSPETAALAKLRFGDASFHEVPLNSKKKIDGFEMELFPNGHILGSTQVLLSDLEAGADYVVTSDFRLKDSLMFKGTEPLKCDTLVLETTFGSPEFVFPRYEDVVSEMSSWISSSAKKGLVLLAGYSLGKAQELTRIANDAGFVPLVHESIFELNKVYETFGVKVGKCEKLDHNLKDFNVLIMPPSLVNKHLFATLEYFDKRKIFSALVTGWSFRGPYDKIFPLSNHADYNDLLSYVDAAKPKLVLTDHGFCAEFARKLSRKGYNAKPLKQHKQKLLSEY